MESIILLGSISFEGNEPEYFGVFMDSLMYKQASKHTQNFIHIQ